MARGRKSYTLDERLERITDEIEDTEKLLKEMKREKREIEEQIHQNQLVEIDELISESGLTFEEVKELLSREQE